MQISEIISGTDTDPALHDLLMRLHKGATATFNAKKAAQVLNLFPGWTMTPAALIKPSTETRSLGIVAWLHDHRVTLHARASRDSTTLQVTSFSEDEALILQRELASHAVTALPDPKKVKADDYFVMNLSPIKQTSDRGYAWSFDLFRKCKGYTITAPDGQTFDVVGPVQVLGYEGTKDFPAFFTWALKHTDLEDAVNAKLGLSKHVKAADRPRVPVGSQVIGTCAICERAQVVRHGLMVNHGYQRPGYGYIVGECFGAGHEPYEVSPKACEAYIPVLADIKARTEVRLGNLQTGKIKSFTEKKRNWKTNRDEIITIDAGTPAYDSRLKSEIFQAKAQIEQVIQHVAVMQKRITNWKPGTLRTN